MLLTDVASNLSRQEWVWTEFVRRARSYILHGTRTTLCFGASFVCNITDMLESITLFLLNADDTKV